MAGIRLAACLLLSALVVHAQDDQLKDLVQEPEVADRSIVYHITSPSTVKLFTQYPVSITIHNSSSPVTVKLQLVQHFYEADLNDTIVTDASATISSGQTQRVLLDIKNLENRGIYMLRVKGQDQQGKKFNDETSSLTVQRSNNLIFVQTDKPLYKLGDAVKFRVLLVDLALRPVQVPFDVKIYDPQRNLIQQHLQVNNGKDTTPKLLPAGYFEQQLQLASEAPLGEWQIEITSAEERTTTKRFSVEEYVLPRFDVQLKAPDYIIKLQDSFEVTLNCSYTFGQPVKGRAVIQVDGPRRWQWELRRDIGLSKTFTIPDFNGTAKIRVYVNDVVNRTEDFTNWNTISLSANVTEGTTNTTRLANSKSVSMKIDAYKLDIIKTTNTFKPGFPYTITVAATQHDGRPIPPTKSQLVVKVSQSGSTFSGDYFDEEIRQFTVPVNGTVDVTFTPAKQSRTIFFRARLGRVKTSSTISGFDSPSNSFMQIYPQSKNLSVQDTAVFSINLTNAATLLNYTVISKSQILLEDSLPIDGTSALLSIALNASFAPRSRLLVYYMRDDSEVVANLIDFQVDGVMRNNITVSLTPVNRTDYAEPGENTLVRVQTTPKSFVALLAMDQSLLLLKQGNDITENQVTDSYKEFDRDSWSFDNAFGSSAYKLPDGRSVYRFLEQAGLAVMSNAAIPGNPKNPDVDDYPSPSVQYAFASSASVGAGGGLYTVSANSARAPMAQAGFIRPSPSAKEPVVRKDFRETFLYETFTAGDDGKIEFTRNVPDTITSWVATGISLNSESGLGLTKLPAKLRVFRPFFAVLNLPFSIVRGELVHLDVLVFNYLDEDQDVQVSLEISGQDPKGNRFVAPQKTKTVTVKSGESVSVSFPVKPEVVGNIDVKATATSPNAGDSLIRQLRVKPEGLRQQFNAPFFVDLRKDSSYSAEVHIPLPDADTLIDGSQKLVFSAIGDLLGPTIYGIDNLIQLPYGCGEQNMALFAPNVYVMKYLSAAGRLDDETKNKLLRNLRSGYQRQLIFKHYDGSYSAFGSSDGDGSTFLTAFVARTFYQARDFITIDNDTLVRSLNWLTDKQAENGSFPEIGKVFDRELQGGAGKGTALTAYVLVTLLETQSLGNFSENIRNATRYLESQLKGIRTDPYQLSIVNYALQQAGSNNYEFSQQSLNNLAVIANGTKHWEKPREKETQTFGKYIWEYTLPAKDIEMTAYNLLAAVKKNDVEGGFPILAWLLSKRNEQGGFQSSQDTVVGLQAIAEFAQQVISHNRDITIHVTADDHKSDFSISDENALILQNAEPGKFYNDIRVEASGKGTALVQVSWIYNVRNTSDEGFVLTTRISKAKTDIDIRICSKYAKKTPSNMAVMEVNLPSGYQVDEEEAKKLTASIPDLSRVDVENDSTKLNLYFDKVDGHEKCVSLTAYRMFNVDNLQDSNVILYDYYKPSDRKTVFYNVKNALA